MSKRTIRYIVVAVLLVAGLVVAYFALQEPKPAQPAAGEQKPGGGDVVASAGKGKPVMRF